MPKETRRYIAKSVVELRQIAAANPGDTKIIGDVKVELSYRKSSAARTLLLEIESGAVSPPTSLIKSKEKMPESSLGESECAALEARYELLRATFSEQGEVLARWGLTESMPVDLLVKIMSLWAEKFSGGYVHVIRSQEQFLKDCKFLGIALPKTKKDLK
jgi:hypothetical protein